MSTQLGPEPVAERLEPVDLRREPLSPRPKPAHVRPKPAHLRPELVEGPAATSSARMVVQSVAGVTLLYVRRAGMDRLQQTLKRTLDIAGSVGGLLLLSPLLIAVALWIKRDSRGPVFFRQVRVGRDEEPFTCWKFRTMERDAEARLPELEHLSEGPGLLFKLKEDPRVTRAGRTVLSVVARVSNGAA